MAFQKGNQAYKNAMHKRNDTTVELLAQLNAMSKTYKGSLEERTNLNRLIENLVAKATTGDDVVDKDGNLIKKGTGDLQAILAIMDRVDGKPSQQIVGPDNGPLQVEYRTLEEVHMFLLQRGIDAVRVPPPPLRLISKQETE